MAAKPKKSSRRISDNTEKKQRIVSARSKANLKPFKAGESGNPAGRPKGARNRLSEKVFENFADLWDAAGLAKLKARDLATFVRLAVSLVPKQIELEARAAVYHIADRPLSPDEWAAEFCEPENRVEPSRGAAKSARKVRPS